MMGKETSNCPECGLTLYRQVDQCPRCFAPISPMGEETPIVERIYEPGPGEKPPKEKKNVRRVFAVIFVLIIVVIIVFAIAFNYLIPRIELKLISDYKESSGLSINMDFKVKNEGTLGIQHYSMNVTIFDESGGVVAEKDYYVSDVDPHTQEKFDNIHFFGDQFEHYKITIEVEFESEGKGYDMNHEHKVKEAMQYRWEDTFSQWGG
jgi:hypothetical protein